MNASQIEEALVSLYLRLNGYFTTGFIVHAPYRNKTEVDILAVRFPLHSEPEREIGLCPALTPPHDRIDFIIGEVKGGAKPKFNAQLRNGPEAVRSVLRRVGAFSDDAIVELVPRIQSLLDPLVITRTAEIPKIELHRDQCFSQVPAQIRLPLFAMGKNRQVHSRSGYVFGSEVLEYVWKCLVPEKERCDCAASYNFEQWGPQYVLLVRYFKDRALMGPGSVSDLVAFVSRSGNAIYASPALRQPEFA